MFLSKMLKAADHPMLMGKGGRMVSQLTKIVLFLSTKFFSQTTRSVKCKEWTLPPWGTTLLSRFILQRKVNNFTILSLAPGGHHGWRHDLRGGLHREACRQDHWCQLGQGQGPWRPYGLLQGQVTKLKTWRTSHLNISITRSLDISSCFQAIPNVQPLGQGLWEDCRG